MNDYRTYDPDLDFVHVTRDGRILFEGEKIGRVDQVDSEIGKWRAEIGDPAKPEAWPPYRASYYRTKSGAVADVLESLEVPS